MKKQKRELVTRTKAVIADMIKGRQLLVENVFHNSMIHAFIFL